MLKYVVLSLIMLVSTAHAVDMPAPEPVVDELIVEVDQLNDSIESLNQSIQGLNKSIESLNVSLQDMNSTLQRVNTESIATASRSQLLFLFTFIALVMIFVSLIPHAIGWFRHGK